MCADSENSSDKRTYPRTLVSSRGEAIVADAQLEFNAMEALARFRCGFCDYPVLSSWHFCPMCGGVLEWKAVQ